MASLKKLDETGSKTEKYTVTGFENLIPEIRKINKDIEELNSKKNTMRDLIMNKVVDIKNKEEAAGRLYKSYIIASEDDEPVTVLFKNMFSKLSVDNEETLRKNLGEYFDKLFTKSVSTSLKRNVNLDTMKELLKDRFSEFFETSEFISFVKDFMEQRAELRSKLNKKTNVLIDKWTRECQAKPDLRLK